MMGSPERSSPRSGHHLELPEGRPPELLQHRRLGLPGHRAWGRCTNILWTVGAPWAGVAPG